MINYQTSFPIDKVRADFPMLSALENGKPIAYFDTTATAQKPRMVIDRMKHFDADEYATVHRGSYRLGERSTALYDGTRKTVARFIGAGDPREIIFTSGTTQSINLAAHSLGKHLIRAGDEIVLTRMEHHANIVPWQQLAIDRGAVLKVAEVKDNGELDLNSLESIIGPKTKIVAVTHASNVLGTVNPVKEICAMAKKAGAVSLVDGAQSVPHAKVDVRDIGCDLFAFSGHKLYGPTGVGVLYGRYDLLEKLPPYVTGGDMILYVTFEKSSFAKPPGRFEAGTPPITQVIGLGATIEYLESIGMDNIAAREHELLVYATKKLGSVPGLRIIGTAPGKAAIISIALDSAHPHDVVTILDQEGICCRGGHHCAQPLMERFSVPATTRASISFYNTTEEIDRLESALRKVNEVFG